jgi:thiamine biosynthesis lipoprotein
MDPAALPQARRELVRELRAVDLVASRFRQDSELAGLNRRAGEPVRVSRRLFDAVALAVDVASRTGGLVDPTVGRALRLAGYDRTFVAVRARDGNFVAVSHRSSGWESIQLDPERLEIRVPAGVELDLGATAKATTADLVAARVYEITGSGVLVSLGGDVATAGTVPGAGWPIRIADHHDAPLASEGPVVALRGGGLATSGVEARRWRVSGGERHHIIDPRTGGSATTPWRTVTVTGAACVDANAASTAAVVLGADAPAWLALRGLSARLARHDGSVQLVGEWPRTEAKAA